MSAIGPASQPLQPTAPTGAAPATPADPAAPLAFAAFASDPAFGEVAAGTRDIGFGAEGPHVQVLEEALLGLGYGFRGGNRADDQLTRATQGALSRFQRDQGLAQSGTLNAETLRALDVALAGTAAASSAPADPAPTTGRPVISAPAFDAADLPDTADLNRIERALHRAVQDGVLEGDEVDALFGAAGNRVSDSELEDLKAAIFHNMGTGWPVFEVTAEARARAGELATVRGLDAAQATEILSGVSFGGTTVPQAVKDVIANARMSGAVAYDVNEQRTNSDGEVVGVYSPYPATTPPIGNMTFDYTEITPEKLIEDLNDTQVTYNRMIGTETKTWTDPATGENHEYKAVRYEPGQGGTGNVMSNYDEANHDDIYARGSSGQKWANNFAILADGSIHALPAARRSELQDLILTNPHLSRGKNMMFNGHLDIRGGVVTGVEMSGRLSKRAAQGKETFVDPIAVLKAWGFEIAPGVQVRYGNTSRGTPVRDEATGTIRQP